MTTRTAQERERRRNLTDASVTPLPILDGLFRRVPDPRLWMQPPASLAAPATPLEGAATSGTEQ
ncbi:hypothetical protein GCM10010394_15030 [Streptomyces crystallinus]|uniref:Uncharacterized protein n=1 Tax=Streptomyces crystallinus TaxID=68191 RepID=A0ABP3QHT5_9ACTN